MAPFWLSALALVSAQTSTATNARSKTDTVVVKGTSRSEVPQEAVSTLYLEKFELEAADLGELLARQQGVIVQRQGGLGSTARFSLNGLSGDQIRFFYDGLPLELAGLPMGIANVPPAILEELVIYRGVVPTRLGADALGGAVELRTELNVVGTEVEASYLTGSFATHRLSAVGAHAFGDRFFARAFAYFDRTDNNYSILDPLQRRDEVENPQRVERFNDAYQAGGGSLEIGLSETSASSLSLALRAYFSLVD